MKEQMDPDEIQAQHPAAPFTAADLPVDAEGRIYHLQIKPEQMAPDILLVGDPGRAEVIGSSFLHDIEVEHEHRGLVTVTGISEITREPATIISPVRTTVVTSGMGASSLEIVVNELAALNEVDFATRTRKTDYPRLHVIRVGTSGGLQASTALGTPVITSYAIGLDNTGLYYDAPYPDETCARLEQELDEEIGRSMKAGSRFQGKIHPYVARAEPAIVVALAQAADALGVQTKLGLTVSGSGFFAPQGREVARLKPSVVEVDKILADYDPRLAGQRIENMEMEASFLLHFLGGLGYWAGAICPAIANRRRNTFEGDYQQSIKNATRVALLALASLRMK